MQFADRLNNVETSAIRELFKLLGKPGIISFAGGFPDPALFDVAGIAESTAAVLANNPGPVLQYGATEGFGPLPMNSQSFEFLQELNGARAVLFTATRVIGYLARPQLIVVNEDLLDVDAPGGAAVLAAGVSARLIDQNALGQRVGIAGSPKRARRGDGNMIEVIDIELPNGQFRTVLLANIEIVA